MEAFLLEIDACLYQLQLYGTLHNVDCTMVTVTDNNLVFDSLIYSELDYDPLLCFLEVMKAQQSTGYNTFSHEHYW